MDLDPDRCADLVERGDARFDGWLYVGVTSTGIYCRPSCPARTPKRSNMTFHPSAAAAQRAGFRACKRCRPDAAPGSPEWDARADVAGRAVRLITDGVVDREGVTGLAERLGYSVRHLSRLLVTEVGAGPLALARSQRVRSARTLIETTGMTFAEIAFAAGFDSIRQFNDSVRETYAASPTDLRRGKQTVDAADGAIVVRLAVRRPFDIDGLLSFVAARAIAGVETVRGSTICRTVDLPGGPGTVTLDLSDDGVSARLQLTDLADLSAVIARCRRWLDLDADPEATDAVLGASEILAPSVSRHPGRRVPGAVDGWELAARAVLGQQVSLASARSSLARLAAEHGRPHDDLTVFPSAEVVAAIDPTSLAMPLRRATTLVDLAEAVASRTICLDAGADRDRSTARLLTISGIGDWTARYIRMRALRDPDVLLDSDLVIRRVLERHNVNAAEIERWRPWRSAASMHLWAVGGATAPSRNIVLNGAPS